MVQRHLAKAGRATAPRRRADDPACCSAAGSFLVAPALARTLRRLPGRHRRRRGVLPRLRGHGAAARGRLPGLRPAARRPARSCATPAGCARSRFARPGRLVYGGAVADALVRFKHGRQLAPARPLGRCLVPLLDWAAADGVDAVAAGAAAPGAGCAPRGFNQALELVREAIAHRARAGCPRRRLPQSGPIGPAGVTGTPRRWAASRRAVRRSRLAGAFASPIRALVRGRRLLVIDDVMTSGATLAECARTLLDAGASEVRVAALARACRDDGPDEPAPTANRRDPDGFGAVRARVPP